MIKQPWLSVRTPATVAVGALCFIFLVATAASYGQTTIAYWDFEDGVAGQPFDDSPNDASDGTEGETGSADTVNGLVMRGWNDYYGPYWSDDTTANSTSTLAMRNADNHQDGYVVYDSEAATNPIHDWTPTAWTIECSVYLNEIAGWETLIGIDGSTDGGAGSDFYLSNNGIDDRFRIDVVTTGGTRWVLDGDYTVQTNRWYALAARSDGATLDLWLDDGTGYQEIGSMDISAQSVADNALPGTQNNWTFGRGWYNGGFVDHIDGYMDNIRFSEGVVAPANLLPIEVPATLVAEVNMSTGEVTLRNDSLDPISFDYYILETSNATLDTVSWNSLDDQSYDAGLPADFDGSGTVDGADLTQWQSDLGVNADSDADRDGDSDIADIMIWQQQVGQVAGPGDSWDEAGGVSASQLAELFLNNASTLGAGESVSIGNAFDTSVLGAGVEDGELLFQYGIEGGGLALGKVSFVSGAIVAIPEPATLSLLALMGAGVLAVRRRGR